MQLRDIQDCIVAQLRDIQGCTVAQLRGIQDCIVVQLRDIQDCIVVQLRDTQDCIVVQLRDIQGCIVAQLRDIQDCILRRDSSVRIATRYGLDGPGIESRCGRDFPHQSRLALMLTHPPIQWVVGLFPGGKAAGAWR